MIERLTAASGDPILRVNGRLLASRFDPRAEAREFAERRSTLVKEVRTVIVLGYGSGYHVAEVARRTSARILVIEAIPEIAATFDQTASRAIVHCAPAAEDVIKKLRTEGALRESYVVFVHPASRALAPAYYARVARELNSRDEASLARAWAARGWELPAAGFAIGSTDETKPLTIHDLSALELPATAARTRALLAALRELVK